jgi:protein TonB
MTTLSFNTRNRIRGGAIALAVEGLIGYALILGFSVDLPTAVGEQFKIFNLAAPKPPPPIVTRPKPPPTYSKKAKGAASPRNIKSRATEIVAPKLPPPIPSPVVAAPMPFVGSDSSTGASRMKGPGTGAGGVGWGPGGGGSGEGDGDTPPKWKSGKIKSSDFKAIPTTGVYNVSVQYTVETTGRASHCVATRSSGYVAYDQMVCRLIEERFRFKPAHDIDGIPFAARRGEDHLFTFDEETTTTPAREHDDDR